MRREHPAFAPPRPAWRAAGVALLASLLGGCYATAQAPAPPAPVDYRLRHPIVVSEGEQKAELFIGAARGGLTPMQRAEVLAFAQSWKREATGGVVIEVPSGTANARAAGDSLHEIQSILAAAGVPPHGLYVIPYRPAEPVKLATIKLKYPKMVAEAGPCGLWPADLGPNSWNPDYIENKPYWNLGCGTQRNLAAMVENPADLAQPRGETPASTARRTTVLDKYGKGESTAAADKNEGKGKISDIGR